MLSSDDRQALLTLARRVIEATARRESGSISRPGGSTILDEPRGAFVTLHEGGALRGCIGYVEPTEPLWQVVAHAAEAACTRDPRFAPVRESELPAIDLEISVLGLPEPISGAADIEIGRDGLILELGSARGLLLPQVAPEWGYGPEEFLDALCRKAGLPPGAWRESGARLYRFSAEVFS
ncbi:MAG: AmmeMemoRadiSam system protein A [Chrysiogenetes bacterium]|nr:AmmeMemoRadiSam system protein A [Chrysiogenetes bacterium]